MHARHNIPRPPNGQPDILGAIYGDGSIFIGENVNPEEHRIVAKVDALMDLCDRLEASLAATAATRRSLLDALLAEALTPAGARELEAAE
jgi:hypothetical protein